jgi:membrane-associated phospholipid phosphatase
VPIAITACRELEDEDFPMHDRATPGRASRAVRMGVSLFFGAAICSSRALCAESFSLPNAWDDIKLYYTSPLRWDEEDWLYFGGTLTAIGTSHVFDQRVREHFADPNASLNGADKNSLRDALPAVALIAGTGVYAAFIRDRDGYDETWALLEAGILSTATGEALTYAAGRERPDATTSPNEWRQGGDSFPSVHASAAFAIGMVFAESGNDEYRWIRRFIGYGVAGATGYIRVRDNVHWLSDTVAGAALGIATARFVLNRQNSSHPADGDSVSAVQFQPAGDGWKLSYTVRTR